MAVRYYACVIIMWMTAVPLFADSLTITMEATGSGFFNGSFFSNAPFNITSTADTAQISSLGFGVYAVQSNAVVSVAGLGSDTFAVMSFNVSNQTIPSAGISDFSNDNAILFVNHPEFATYDLSTSIGPLIGPPTFNPGTQFPTFNGIFILSSVSSTTYTATVTPVPEPIGGAMALVFLFLRWLRRVT